MKAQRTKLSPPQLAKQWGVDPAKILHWIHTGELAAIDISKIRGGRPRFLIDRADIAIFEARRSAAPAPKVTRRRKRSVDYVEYF